MLMPIDPKRRRVFLVWAALIHKRETRSVLRDAYGEALAAKLPSSQHYKWGDCSRFRICSSRSRFCCLTRCRCAAKQIKSHSTKSLRRLKRRVIRVFVMDPRSLTLLARICGCTARPDQAQPKCDASAVHHLRLPRRIRARPPTCDTARY
jgi:hypothetical protein